MIKYRKNLWNPKSMKIDIDNKELLKTIAIPFYEYQKETLLDPFRKIHWRKIQNWVKANKIYIHESRNFGIVIHSIGQKKTIKSFGGHKLLECSKGDIQIDAFYVTDGYENEFVQYIKNIINQLSDDVSNQKIIAIVDIENKKAVHLMDKLDLNYICTKISSFADYKSIYVNSNVQHEQIPTNEEIGIHKLNKKFDITSLINEIKELPEWANHYSNYNKKSSWSALSVKGYSDDITFIEQPAEMSKSWKKENPEKLEWTIRETSLLDKLPSIRKILNQIDGNTHRVRLMRLSANQGTLGRHTDAQTDYHGIKIGKIMRLHIPLITNNEVNFKVWDLKGVKIEKHMKMGELWYLDVRKPHEAVNNGLNDRIHLVIDVESNKNVLSML
jgi:hypothetical protein